MQWFFLLTFFVHWVTNSHLYSRRNCTQKVSVFTIILYVMNKNNLYNLYFDDICTFGLSPQRELNLPLFFSFLPVVGSPELPTSSLPSALCDDNWVMEGGEELASLHLASSSLVNYLTRASSNA